MYTIYKATNKITNHSYIGFDCNWPYRKAAHKCAVKRGSKLVFHNAIRSYGWDQFEWEVLEQSEDRNIMLKEKEEFYIRKFNTHYIDGNGYNMTYGGEATLGWVPSEETRKKIGKANSRCTLTEEGRKSKRKFMKKNNPMNNKKSREKLSRKLLEVKPGARKVTDGIKIYESIRDAHKEHQHIKYITLWYHINNNKNGWSYI